jgi:flagellar biosynthesis anti-sigma factor FlgM
MNVRNGIENLTQVFPSQTATEATASKGSAQQSESLAGDKAQISEVAVQAAQPVSSSDVRLDKVASIQSALQSGTYQVSAADVAQKVIASMLSSEK